MGRDCDIMVCDAMVRRYLPAMRAEMVFRLVNNQGFSQSDAAKKLGVSRAAISQYMSKKRGGSGAIEFSGEARCAHQPVGPGRERRGFHYYPL